MKPRKNKHQNRTSAKAPRGAKSPPPQSISASDKSLFIVCCILFFVIVVLFIARSIIQQITINGLFNLCITVASGIFLVICYKLRASCDDTASARKKPRKFPFITCLLLCAVIAILCIVKPYLSFTRISEEGFCKMLEILANYYLIIFGGIFASVTMHVLQTKPRKYIHFGKLVCSLLFFACSLLVSLIGAMDEGELWRQTQIWGYALSAYCVSCWLGCHDLETAESRPKKKTSK